MVRSSPVQQAAHPGRWRRSVGFERAVLVVEIRAAPARARPRAHPRDQHASSSASRWPRSPSARGRAAGSPTVCRPGALLGPLLAISGVAVAADAVRRAGARRDGRRGRCPARGHARDPRARRAALGGHADGHQAAADRPRRDRHASSAGCPASARSGAIVGHRAHRLRPVSRVPVSAILVGLGLPAGASAAVGQVAAGAVRGVRGCRRCCWCCSAGPSARRSARAAATPRRSTTARGRRPTPSATAGPGAGARRPAALLRRPRRPDPPRVRLRRRRSRRWPTPRSPPASRSRPTTSAAAA